MVSKSVRGGKLYLKKGTVVDVHPGNYCDITLDEDRTTLQVGLSQGQLLFLGEVLNRRGSEIVSDALAKRHSSDPQTQGCMHLRARFVKGR